MSNRRVCISMLAVSVPDASAWPASRRRTVAARLRYVPEPPTRAAILRPMDRLYRSRDDRMLAGVAGGLADYWGADPSLIRVIWALLIIFTGGLALVVYIVMAIVIPEEPDILPTAAGPTPGPGAGGRHAGGRRGMGLTRRRGGGSSRGSRGPRRRAARTRWQARFRRRRPRRVPDHPRRLLPRPRVPAGDRFRLVLAAHPRRARDRPGRHRRSSPERSRLTDPGSQRRRAPQPASPPNRHLVSPARGPTATGPHPSLPCTTSPRGPAQPWEGTCDRWTLEIPPGC